MSSRIFTLKRVTETAAGTFGVLLADGIVPIMVTLENQWRFNAPNESCIPPGFYECNRCSNSPQYDYFPSAKYGNAFVVENVPGRSKILFHKGNTIDDTDGCILLGEKFGVIQGKAAVLSSGTAYDDFLHILRDDDTFNLIVTTV